jgi:hypothetical protein
LADRLGVNVLAKVIFSFSPDMVMSPLALPRELLDLKLDALVTDLGDGALKDMLSQLKNRPTFEEQWPDQYQQGLRKGKARILHLESIRQDRYTMVDILRQDQDIYDWWQSID